MSDATRSAGETALVTLIGCGNIGSRLLQSLARVEGRRISIVVVEPFEPARRQARSRFEEALGARGHELRFADAPATCAALGIVATDSRNRLAALQALSAVGLPRRLVLEKFLFARAAEYSEAGQLIAAGGAEAFVNCSRNEWPGYAALKRSEGAAITAMEVSGGDWGLACNAIHHLSLLEYLTGDEIVSLTWAEAPKPREAKRPGYRELTGRLTGRTRRGVAFGIESLPASREPLTVRLSTPGGEIVVNETAATVSRNGVSEPFGIRLASQLETVFARILADGESALPRYDASARLHLLTLETLNEGFFGHRDRETECPVT